MARELPSGPPGRESYTVSSLEQARLLTDRTKLRLLMAFAEGPATTMQVADVLGEQPTRLYRHVDALVSAGLLELVGERRKRGTTEKYLRAVARRFEVDHTLFTNEASGDANPLVRDLFRTAEAGVRRDLGLGRKATPMVVGAKLKGSQERIAQFWERLQEVVLSAVPDAAGDMESGSAEGADGGTLRTFSVLIAIYEDDLSE